MDGTLNLGCPLGGVWGASSQMRRAVSLSTWGWPEPYVWGSSEVGLEQSSSHRGGVVLRPYRRQERRQPVREVGQLGEEMA